MRFTIRDVLWLMVVVAVAMSWFLQRAGSDMQFSTREIVMLTAIIVLSVGWLMDRTNLAGRVEYAGLEVRLIAADLPRLTDGKLAPGKKVIVEMNEKGEISIGPAP